MHLSDSFVRALQLGWCGDDTIAPVAEAAWIALGLTDLDVADVMDELQDGLVGAATFIELINEQQRAG